MQADTSNGSIDTDFDLATHSSDSDKTLSGSVGAGGPLVHITTTNGDISVHKGDVAPLPLALPAPPKITLSHRYRLPLRSTNLRPNNPGWQRWDGMFLRPPGAAVVRSVI